MNSKPDKLLVKIGAFSSDSYEIEWVKDQLIYGNGLLLEEEHQVAPDENQWKHFWSEMENINIWDWAPIYLAPVLDGTSWSLELQQRNKSINTSGHMAYPDPNDLSKGVNLEVTDPFKDLIEAINKLIGEKYIPS